MANDIRFIWNNETQSADLVLADGGGDLIRENGLETAIWMSIYSDRRASDDDEIDDNDDKRGWWGDQISSFENDEIGSKLWQLDRSKTNDERIEKARQFIIESLEWLLDDGVAESYDVDVQRQKTGETETLAAKIDVLKYDSNEVESFKFDDLWRAQVAV
jgi:phage gp46-like protein